MKENKEKSVCCGKEKCCEDCLEPICLHCGKPFIPAEDKEEDSNCKYCMNGCFRCSATPSQESKFSDFFHKASPEEKEKVMMEVIKESTEEQKKVLESKSWEEDFDKRFDFLHWASVNVNGWNILKGFISSLLAKQKAEIVEEIKEKTRNYLDHLKEEDVEDIISNLNGSHPTVE